MPQISVIIPVYNTEKYLRRCLDSMLRQRFTDFELLLIDDGSDDHSAGICEAYAARDNRVILLKTSHVGVGAARNLGLSQAKGKYIMFCDSDDYVEPEWMEALYRGALEHPDSLVNCEYTEVYAPSMTAEPKELAGIRESKVIDKRHYFPMLQQAYVMHIWTRIFRTDIIRGHHLRFAEDMTQGEDTVFIIDYLRCCDSFYYIHRPLYYWMYNGTETLSRQYYPHYYEDMKTIYLARKTVIADEYLQAFYDYSFDRFMCCVELAFDSRNAETEREKLAYCNRIFRDAAFQETVSHVSRARCSARQKRIIRLRSYSLYRFLLRLSARK